MALRSPFSMSLSKAFKSSVFKNNNIPSTVISSISTALYYTVSIIHSPTKYYSKEASLMSKPTGHLVQFWIIKLLLIVFAFNEHVKRTGLRYL